MKLLDLNTEDIGPQYGLDFIENQYLGAEIAQVQQHLIMAFGDDAILEGKTALDIGCGGPSKYSCYHPRRFEPWASRVLTALGMQVTGVDLQAEAPEVQTPPGSWAYLQRDLRTEGTLENIPDESTDLIILKRLFHVFDYDEIALEFRRLFLENRKEYNRIRKELVSTTGRVLKPGGKLLFNGFTFERGSSSSLWKVEEGPMKVGARLAKQICEFPLVAHHTEGANWDFNREDDPAY